MTDSSKNGSVKAAKADRPVYSVTCSDCGKATTVPFKPSGDRPVYCQECFTKRRGVQNPPKQPAPNAPKNIQPQNKPQNGQAAGLGEIKRSLDMLNSKVDRIIQSIEQAKTPEVEAPKKAEKKAAAKKKVTSKKK